MARRVVVNDNKALGGTLIEDELAKSDIDIEVDALHIETVSELIDTLEGADALAAAAGVPITADLIEQVDSLEAIGRTGIGCDNVDIEAALENSVTVINVPSYAIEEVSTHAMALLLACVRKLPLYDQYLKESGWDWRIGRPIERLRGQTLGVVAFGNIARRFVEKVHPFDIEILAYDPYVDQSEMDAYGVKKISFDALCERADLISVHAPLTDETKGLFDRAAFEQLKDDAILVNTSRGPVIELDALYEALASGDLMMAGLDVFEDEPLPDDAPISDLDNVVLTPHTAWYSDVSQEEVYRLLAQDIIHVFEGKEPTGKLNPAEIPWR